MYKVGAEMCISEFVTYLHSAKIMMIFMYEYSYVSGTRVYNRCLTRINTYVVGVGLCRGGLK